MNRAWSTLEVKALDSEQRIIEGIASTPSPDADGDVMEPAGAQFKLPMPFLWFHNQKEPIGEVFEAAVTSAGIRIKARISKVSEPGKLKDRVDEAWQSIKADPPLVRGLSIGWKALDAEPIRGTRYTRFKRWLWGETSAVSVPMNAETTILAVKSADLAVSGHTQNAPAVVGTLPVVRAEKGAKAMATVAEQITGFENTRAAKSARMNELMTKAAESGVTLDQPQTDEYDTLDTEVSAIDAHLVRLRKLEKSNIATATPITNVTDTKAASDLRGGHIPQVQITPNAPKGTAFTRYAMCLASAKGDSYAAINRAKSYTDMPEVEMMVKASLDWNTKGGDWQTKAAVAAGTTTDATWAGPLVVVQPLVNEFLELLRPRTLIDSNPGFRKVPFNVSVPAQTGGGTYGWVGQNKPKPVTSAAFSTVSVGFAKAAGIIVLTEELVKLSSPSAEETIRNEMIAGMRQFLDTQLNDPAVAAVAGVNPASITNGAPTAAASGATAAAARADIVARIQTFTAAELSLAESEIWMNESNAFALANALNSLGQPLFPGFTGQTGSFIMGLRARVTNVVSTRVILVHTPSILFADDGGVNIDASREASVQMDTAPTDPTDATTVLVSLWQRNLVGLKAERFISWTKSRTAAVTYISAAAYTGA